ncbi:GNAT family N-acetyltransferase [Nocardioides rubriscoriae]|uniref:GNAT family N-acetyltransferase n=1 Tax=Nocardioides rubriscoriae TaxID=642762 RepID=UPI0011DF68F1|nr:GNAT family N-acetyltransferase [Nocardioides rubriscoriae]
MTAQAAVPHGATGSRPPLRAAVVDDLDAAGALAPDWEALADELGAGALVRPAYALAWWRHLGPGRLRVVTVHDGDRLVALAPLHERRVGPVRVVRWLGHGLGTIAEALVRPGDDAAAALLWATAAGPRVLLDLVESRAASPALPALVAAGRTTVTPRDHCPVIDLGADGLAHLALPGAKNLRKLLRRADAALDAAGLEHRVEVAVDPERLEALLPDLRTVFDAAETARPRQHLLRPPYDGFVLDYVRGETAAGRGVTLVGYVGDRPVSFLLAMVVAQDVPTLALWISRYDPAFQDYSPGHLMLRETFRWAPVRGIGRIDQLLGISQTKRQWSTASYDTVDVRHGGRLARALVDAATAAAEAVRRRRGGE